MSDHLMEFGFGQNDEVASGKTQKYKGETGKTDRISFVWWEVVDGKPVLDAKSPKFIGAKRNYLPNVGYFLNKGPEYTKIAGEQPKTQIATIIAVWPTSKDGDLDKSRLKDVRVMPWIFSSDKYENLKRRHNQFHVGKHDILATCTAADFQKMDFVPCTESIFATLLNSDKEPARKIAETILAKVAAIASNISNDIARDLTLDQIREKLTGSSGSGPVAGGGFGGGNTVAGDAVDEILNDLIDP